MSRWPERAWSLEASEKIASEFKTDWRDSALSEKTCEPWHPAAIDFDSNPDDARRASSTPASVEIDGRRRVSVMIRDRVVC